MAQAREESPPRVPLVDAVRDALARNPTVIVAEAEIRRAEGLQDEARAGALPTLSGFASYTRLDSDRLSGPAVVAPVGALNANAVLTVPLVVPKTLAQWSVASNNIDAARASAADTRRTLAIAVARAYLTIVAQKRVIEAVSRARDTDAAHATFAQQRYAGGVGTRLDVVRAEQQLQSDVANVEQQWTGLTRDREALGVLVGVGGPLDADEPDLRAPTDPSTAMRDAEHRTDVVANDARRLSAEKAVREGWTDYSPYLVGFGEVFAQDPATPTVPRTGWQAELLLTVPFYDGGQRYGQERERSALRDEARANLDATLRQARSDVRTAFAEVQRADAALAASQQAADLARSGLELAEVAYRGGATTNIEVIDAERTARDAETAVAVAEDGARQARLDALAAAGRFP